MLVTFLFLTSGEKKHKLFYNGGSIVERVRPPDDIGRTSYRTTTDHPVSKT
jgi:hypothetical protein